jgi:hypothetical protein
VAGVAGLAGVALVGAVVARRTDPSGGAASSAAPLSCGQDGDRLVPVGAVSVASRDASDVDGRRCSRPDNNC